MRYELIDNYFETILFQNTVQEYFDTVLAALVSDRAITETKGRFLINGEIRYDGFDMPYHIHVLNGLIPVLVIYEHFLKKNNQIENSESSDWLKTLILGFTFHDTNKLIRVEQIKGKTELEVSIKQLQSDIVQYRVKDFFPDIEKFHNEIYFLALGTENRTQVIANEYPLRKEKIVREYLRPLCHLADGLASIKDFENARIMFDSVQRKFETLSATIGVFPISYVEIHSNPYILTSQKLVQAARKVLANNNKKVLFALRNGFVFFGENVTTEELDQIQVNFELRDLDPLSLTKVDFQQCEFGFINAMPLTPKVLDKILIEKKNQFLSLSPNQPNKFKEFNGFVELIKEFLKSFAPVDEYINIEFSKDNKIYLRFSKDIDSEDFLSFLRVFGLYKMQWLNAKKNKKWKADFDNWLTKASSLETKKKKGSGTQQALNIDLPNPIKSNEYQLNSLADFANEIKSNVNNADTLLKTLLCIVKSWQTVFDSEENIEDSIIRIQQEIIEAFPSTINIGAGINYFINRYFNYRGQEANFLSFYNPHIPAKKQMCLFTGENSSETYKDKVVAFGVKARGFSNRTVTALNNNESKISTWFAEENRLRLTHFAGKSDANTIIYTDFFEANLDIGRDIITAAVKAKDKELRFIKEENAIEFDKNARFQYNLFNLDFVSLKPDIESVFWFTRRMLLIVRRLGLRAYVSGIMSSYQPHKAVFHFENAPSFLKSLSWDKVRLVEVEKVLEEMRLVVLFGKDRIDSNLLHLSTSRNTFFRLFYLLKTDDRKKVINSLIEFINKYPNLFSNMTIIQELVELALPIEVADYRSSSAQETWLIRTATDYLRTYVKQGSSREDIISKISGEIYRRMRHDYVADKLKTIEAFAEGVYDKLFMQGWKEHLPTPNIQKDWIYEFAFIFKKRSLEELDTRTKAKAERLKNQSAEINLNQSNK